MLVLLKRILNRVFFCVFFEKGQITISPFKLFRVSSSNRGCTVVSPHLFFNNKKVKTIKKLI